MAKFCVNKVNGKTFYNIERHDHGGTKEPFLGTTQRFPLTDEQLDTLTLDQLIALYKGEQTKQDARPSWEKDPVLRAAMIERVAKIITQLTGNPNVEGECNNARSLYKKLTGTEFRA